MFDCPAMFTAVSICDCHRKVSISNGVKNAEGQICTAVKNSEVL